ncbi:methyltransferase domain-containing protein [Changchengzhania lutea]|uniref:methyltransferase domain-containing protein n=1 Tax=Changchengzhania lutea TaxID=2049305 RepID=UPI00115D34F6|nr:methyltransferase domain-containing protein [Changchengzhania lutea]
MSLLVNTKYRTDATEIMDDFSIKGELLHDSLDKLAHINTWLGGNQVTINGLKNILKNHPKNQPLKIMDLGCGGGDILRDVAMFGKRNQYQFELIGIDANKATVDYASKLSEGYENISFLHLDIFSEAFNNLEYDVVLGTLFLHHFKEDELIILLKNLLNKTKIGIVINDLHRHKMAYYLFKILCLTISNKMIIEDGLTSVLRGFKKSEIEHISNKIHAKYSVNWKWAFRYQWILQKHHNNI